MGKKTDRQNYCIYVHEFPNGKKYIGQTCVDPETRWRRGNRYSGLMKKAINKYGWDNITHRILLEGLDVETADLIERLLIVLLKTNDPAFGYNITAGGDGYRGATHSDKTKELIRQKAKEQWARQKAAGYVPPPITKEHRAHLSESHKGQKAWNKGKSTMTEEMKQNLRDARKRYWEEVKNGERPAPKRRSKPMGDGKYDGE